MRRLLRFLNSDGERVLLLMLYALVVAVIFIEVVRRFLLNYSSIWGEELARYAFIYLAWIGAALAVRERVHIRFGFLADRLPNRGRIVSFLFADLCMLLMAVIALWYSLSPVIVSIKFGSVTHGLRVSQAIFLMAVPFGFSIMVLRLLQSIRRDARTLFRNDPVFTGNSLF